MLCVGTIFIVCKIKTKRSFWDSVGRFFLQFFLLLLLLQQLALLLLLLRLNVLLSLLILYFRTGFFRHLPHCFPVIYAWIHGIQAVLSLSSENINFRQSVSYIVTRNNLNKQVIKNNIFKHTVYNQSRLNQKGGREAGSSTTP